jgi:hypothetical protein
MYLHFPMDWWSLFTALTIADRLPWPHVPRPTAKPRAKRKQRVGKNDCRLQRCRILLCWALSCSGPAMARKVSKIILAAVVRTVCHHLLELPLN